MSRSNWSKFWVVVAREFNVRVRKRSFIVTTFLVPILMIGIMGFGIYMATNNKSTEHVAVIDKTGEYINLLKNNETYTFFSSNKTLEQYKKEGKNNPEGATVILQITDDLLENPNAIALYGYNEIPMGITSFIKEHLDEYLTDKKLLATNIPNIKQVVEESKVSISIPEYKWKKDGVRERSSGAMAGTIGLILSIISFSFVMTYGSLVMAGVLEEKKSRIMEVMVSSVRPIDMMGGKIVGIGLVGLFQMVLWIAFAIILFIIASTVAFGGIYDLSAIANMSQSDISAGIAMGMNASEFDNLQGIAQIISGYNIANLLVMFLIYFIGGYLLYSSLYAAISASMTSDEDANQYIAPISIIFLFAFYAGLGSMNNPNGSLALWCSMIPFTSPVVMLVRIPSGVPIWQQILSVVILYLTTGGLLWLSAKIYRVGILMYGKRPSLKEMWRWLSYK